MGTFKLAYVGRRNFPKLLTELELRRWFSFEVKDRISIRKAFRSKYWIGAALQLGFTQMTGTTLRSLEYVPQAVLRHLGRQFVQRAPDLATLRTLYRRRQTRFAHQQWASKQCGLREFDAGIERQLTKYIQERTYATLSRVRLALMAREWLYRAYIAIPRRRVIADLVRRVTQVVVLEDHRDSRRYMSEQHIQDFLKELLAHRPGSAMTHLEWLRRPPRRRSLQTVRELLDKYQWLEQRVGRGLHLAIPKERQQVYARRLRRRRAAHVSRLPPFRQELEAICFATVGLATLADDICDLWRFELRRSGLGAIRLLRRK